MDIKEKLNILSEAAKYDVSCSSSGSNRSGANISGLCHSFTQDGRCISLLKILMTNICVYDCKYCINRSSNTIKRAIFTPEEICNLTINFYKRNYIEGLFLSSGVLKDANYTMDKIYQTIYLLRKKYNFKGYIHVKAIPGCDTKMLDKVAFLVDRISINFELPSTQSLKLLAADKNSRDIVETVRHLKNNENNKYVPAGHTSQLIIGATEDSDYKIMKLTSNLYKDYGLKRMYYSAYMPLNNDDLLPTTKAPLKRENRLYQADWLLRFYGFKVDDLLDVDNQNFNLSLDPKSFFALNNLHLFPIEINKANKSDLLKIPGIGPNGVRKILIHRKQTKLDFNHLKKMRIVLKRAKYFITCNGRYYNDINLFNHNTIKQLLLDNEQAYTQLSLFERDVV